MKLRDGLSLGEKVNGGIGLGDGSEELEESSEAADSEEGELGSGVPETAPERESDLAVNSLLGQRVNELAHRRRRWLGLRFRRASFLSCSLAPQRLLQVHSLLCSLFSLLSV